MSCIKITIENNTPSRTKAKDRKKTEIEIKKGRETKTMEAVALWCSFYRANPHRFAKDYLGIHLKLFQKIVICMMFVSTHFMYLAARGQGKTYLMAIFCVIRCILYPGTKICIASKTRGQATEVIDKIKEILLPASPNLRLEIDGEIIVNQQKAVVNFRNSSGIKVVTANDNARHNRANVLIVDEYRMVDLDTVNKVLRKFLTAPRQPGYLKKPEYAHLQERNIEMYASSCWFESHWSFEKAKGYCANMVDDRRKYFICGFPYQLSILEKLLSREQIEDEMSEPDFSEVSFQMEMECLFFSVGTGGLYDYKDVAKNRVLKYPLYPKVSTTRTTDKRMLLLPKHPDEIRLLSADIALMASTKHQNDATSIFINQILPSNSHANRYNYNLIYTENNEGLRTDVQALNIRRLFEDYDCDYLIIDVLGIGMGVTDALMADIFDAETGTTYEALSCYNNLSVAERCHIKDAPKKIWAIVGNESLNSQAALLLRDAFRKGKVRLLASEYDAQDFLTGTQGYNRMTPAERQELLLPYINTSLLINELVSLEYETKGSVVRVKKKAGMRKDRFSSLSYNILAATEIERELLQRQSNKTVGDMVLKFKAPAIRKKY